MSAGRVRTAAAAVVWVLVLGGCAGDRAVEVVGTPGYWHLERVRTSLPWSWLSRIGPVDRWMADRGLTGERWWYVSPEGRRTFLRMVNYVVPDARDPDADAFLGEGARTIAEWGFNAFGYYGDQTRWAAQSGLLPSAFNLGMGGCGIWSGVFDDWEPACHESVIANAAAQLKDRRDVLGVFWEHPGLDSRLLFLTYGGFPATSPSKKRVVESLRTSCRGDVAALRARIPAARGFEDLLAMRSWPQYEEIDRDAADFTALAFSVYGPNMLKPLAKHLPHYLNLGPVLETPTPLGTVAEVARYADLLTFRVRPPSGRLSRRYFDEVHRLTGRPVLIMEVSQSLKVGTGIFELVETEAGQAIGWRRSAGAAAALPYVVGCGWSAYRDTREEGNGLLDTTGAPRQLVVNGMTETNRTLEAAHAKPAVAYYPEYFDDDRFTGGGPVRAVGRLARPVAIDGDLGEWPGAGFWLGGLKLSRDLDPVVFCGVRLGWDDGGLTAALDVHDDGVDLLDPRCWWKYADFVELYLDASGRRPRGYTPSCFHFVLLPRGGGDDGARAYAIAVHHTGSAAPATTYDFKGVEVASSFFRGTRAFEHELKVGRYLRRTRVELPESSWKLEARVPWTLLGVKPRVGARLGFNLVVHRVGRHEEDAFWAAARDEAGVTRPATWGLLRLAERGE